MSTVPLKVINEWPHENGIILKHVEKFQEPEFTQLVEKFFYEDSPGIQWEKLMTEPEALIHDQLKTDFGFPNRVRIGAFDGSRLIGWTLGWQESIANFYMANSGVLESYRRKGIYTALVKKMVELCHLKGFQIIQSKHVATNNAVIVPKLKAGFVITGMELHDAFGTMVNLSYYTNKHRKAVLDSKAGLSRLDPKIEKLFART